MTELPFDGIGVLLCCVSIGHMPEIRQLLDWPFTRPLLESLYIKKSSYLQAKGQEL